MPVSNKFIALGGVAAGLGQALQHQKDQEHQDEMEHMRLITGLVSQGIASGSVTDPNAAFQFLLSGGKGKGKGGKGADLPPPVQSLVQGIQAMPDTGGGGAAGPGPGLGAPGAGPAGPAGTPLPGWQNAVGASSVSPGPSPAPAPDPTGMGFRFLSGPERDARAIGLKGAEAEATTGATYGAKINLARRMYADGIVKSMDEAFERVGLKEPRTHTFAPRPVGRPVPSDQVPEGALTSSGMPVDRTAKFFQPVILSYGDGTFETRYEPSSQAPVGAGAAGGADPARIRTKSIAIKATHPDWTDDQVRAEAGTQILAEDAGKAQATSLGNTQKGENLGIQASVYDKLPEVTANQDGVADPASRAQFETALKALPHGPSILDLVKQAANYEFNPADITSRQVGQLNRAEFESMVHRYDPTWNPSQFPIRQDLKKEWLPAGKAGQAMVSAKTVIGHMNDLAKSAAVLNKYQTDKAGGLTNWATTNWARVIQSDPKAQDALRTYQTKQQAVADELKRLFAVTGAGSQKEIDAWLQLGSPYATPTEKAAFVRGAGALMKDRMRPLIDNYTATMGKPPQPGQSFNALDYTRLQNLGIDASDLTGSSGGQAGPPQPPDVIKSAGPKKKVVMPNGDTWVTDAQGVPHLLPRTPTPQ
jgi:hypothetical protein